MKVFGCVLDRHALLSLEDFPKIRIFPRVETVSRAIGWSDNGRDERCYATGEIVGARETIYPDPCSCAYVYPDAQK